MNSQIFKSFFKCFNIFFSKMFFFNTSMHFESTNRCHNHTSLRLQTVQLTFDIKKLLRPKISTKSCFCNDIISSCKCRNGRIDRITTMSDIRKRSPMDKSRSFFQSLYEIRLNRIFEQGYDSSSAVQHSEFYCFFFKIFPNRNIINSLLQFFQSLRKTNNRHHF